MSTHCCPSLECQMSGHKLGVVSYWAEPRSVGEGIVYPLAAELVAGMCHWRQNRGGCADRETHEQFHFGYTCPYEAMAAVLRGQPDPRDLAAADGLER